MWVELVRLAILKTQGTSGGEGEEAHQRKKWGMSSLALSAESFKCSEVTQAPFSSLHKLSS